MLVLETVLRIRREHAAGKAIKAIMRDLHLSRKVVRKAIRSPEADMGYRREVQPLPKLGPFQGLLTPSADLQAALADPLVQAVIVATPPASGVSGMAWGSDALIRAVVSWAISGRSPRNIFPA